MLVDRERNLVPKAPLRHRRHHVVHLHFRLDTNQPLPHRFHKVVWVVKLLRHRQPPLRLHGLADSFRRLRVQVQAEFTHNNSRVLRPKAHNTLGPHGRLHRPRRTRVILKWTHLGAVGGLDALPAAPPERAAVSVGRIHGLAWLHPLSIKADGNRESPVLSRLHAGLERQPPLFCQSICL
eukprot:1248762-Prymnesium_polylepis.1